MSRPKPRVLMDITDPRTYKTEQILASTGIYAVFFDGKPINLRTVHSLKDTPAKYKKISFSNPGHAFNLAEKLNALFKTDKFKVMMLTQGVEVKENKEE